jgi:outer membrane lipoprotein-sorting protein
MRTRRSSWVSLFAFLAVLALSGLAVAAEFSADFVVTGGGQNGSGTLYVKGKGLIRRDAVQGKQKMTVIVNANKKAIWMVDPVKKTYMASPYQAGAEALLTGVPSAKDTKLVGTETVSGYVCEKRALVGGQQGMTGTVWVAKKLGVTIKAEMKMGKQGSVRVACKNIKERTLPVSLFELPKGYKQMTAQMAPGGGRGGRGPGAGRGRRGR